MNTVINATHATYKQTEFGTIPIDWDSRKFRHLYAESSRNGIYKTSEFQGRGTRIVNMGEMFGYEFIGDQDMSRVALTTRELSASGLHEGDLLFGRRSVVPAGAGKCSLIVKLSEPLTFESSIIRVRLNTKEADPRFYFYFFASPVGRSTVGTIVSGTNVKGIRATELSELQVPYTTKAEQEAIAAALGDADSWIESLEQLVAKKRHLKQAAMQQLLTGKKRLPGFEGEWDTRPVGDLFNISGGLSASRDQLSHDGHCYLHYGDIHGSTKNFIDVDREYQAIPKLDVPLNKVSPSSLLSDGDIVFVDASEDVDGTNRHIVIANPRNIPFISGLHTIVAKPKTDCLEPHYCRYCFETENVKQQFRFFAVGTKVSGVSKTNIVKIEVAVPSPTEQCEIADVLIDMDSEITAIEAKLAKARQIKQAMMQELLTGRIRFV